MPQAIEVGGASSAWGIGGEGESYQELMAQGCHPQAGATLDKLTIVQVHARVGMTLPTYQKLYALAAKDLIAMTCGGEAVRIAHFGTNDARVKAGGTRPAVSEGMFARSLKEYAELSGELNVPTIYVGPHPVDEGGTNPVPGVGYSLHNASIAAHAELIRAQAQADDMPYIDVAAIFAQHEPDAVMSPVDRIHPSPAGHFLIYTAIANAIHGLHKAGQVGPWAEAIYDESRRLQAVAGTGLPFGAQDPLTASLPGR